MRAFLAGLASLVALPLAGAVVLFGTLAASSSDPRAAVAEQSLGIPAPILAAYLHAAGRAPEVAAGCALPWNVLAAVGKVESGHAAGRAISPAGDVGPGVFGPTLDGSVPGTRVVPDTDRGRLDLDAVWDRAVGPMQFLPSTWGRAGLDGNGDGVADPQNVHDSALGAAAFLCRAGEGDLFDGERLARALLAYNPSDAYVSQVRGWVDFYAAFTVSGGTVGAEGLYALPVARDLVTLPMLRRAHHDYPAWDLPLPEGTPVFAVHGGTAAVLEGDPECGSGVTVAGNDGFRYAYCHGSAVLVSQGARVAAGEAVMLSGNTGRSTGPHLHLGIAGPRGSICPQPLLQAWWEGFPLSPALEAVTACVS